MHRCSEHQPLAVRAAVFWGSRTCGDWVWCYSGWVFSETWCVRVKLCLYRWLVSRTGSTPASWRDCRIWLVAPCLRNWSPTGSDTWGLSAWQWVRRCCWWCWWKLSSGTPSFQSSLQIVAPALNDSPKTSEVETTSLGLLWIATPLALKSRHTFGNICHGLKHHKKSQKSYYRHRGETVVPRIHMRWRRGTAIQRRPIAHVIFVVFV